MIISKGVAALRVIRSLNQARPQHNQVVRNSHEWHYRCTTPVSHNKKVLLAAEIVTATAWWWVLWHLMTEPGHVIGEWPYPNPREWTDEELGIPSD